MVIIIYIAELISTQSKNNDAVLKSR